MKKKMYIAGCGGMLGDAFYSFYINVFNLHKLCTSQNIPYKSNLLLHALGIDWAYMNCLGIQNNYFMSFCVPKTGIPATKFT